MVMAATVVYVVFGSCPAPTPLSRFLLPSHTPQNLDIRIRSVHIIKKHLASGVVVATVTCVPPTLLSRLV